MKIICYLIGHKMISDLKSEFRENGIEDGFKYHTKSVNIYICTRCFYCFENITRFGSSAENKDNK